MKLDLHCLRFRNIDSADSPLFSELLCIFLIHCLLKKQEKYVSVCFLGYFIVMWVKFLCFRNLNSSFNGIT